MLSRRGPAAVGWLLLAFAIVWVAIKAFGQGFGINGNAPQFIVVALNGVSLAALYFITASGFTLIFGLMRVVNMAHGSLYLLGGYLALDLNAHGMDWWLALVLAALITGAIGLVMHQALLRWNQGQDLRQALITIAVATILADQMIVHFGATPKAINPPGALANPVGIGIYHLDYPAFRLFIIGAALVVALVLWLVIRFSRFGMIIRAGVDDRDMSSAVGVNVPLVFGAAFFIGAVLAGLGGVMGGTTLSLAPGQDDQFLLSSLVVVIVGGLGSLRGAAVGAILLGLIEQLSAVYLPQQFTNDSILLTFLLLVVVLAVRPAGLFGRTIPTGRTRARMATAPQPLLDWLAARPGVRAALAVALVVALAVVPAIFTTYFTSAVAVRALVFGLAAASLTFLAAYGGIVSLAQTGLYGIAGFVMARFIVNNGMDPILAAALAIAIAVAFGLVFGAVVSGSEGIYLLMITLALGVITYYFFAQVTTFGGHEGINGVHGPGFIGDPVTHPAAIYELILSCCVIVYAAIRLIARTNFGLAMQGVRDDPVRMRALGFNVRLHRTLAFAAGAVIAALAGVLGTWADTRISPGTIQVSQVIQLMTIAVIGGLYRIEGAWIGALVYTLLDTYTRGITERFETWIGVILLVILILSPDGLTGLAQKASARLLRRPAPSPPAAPTSERAGAEPEPGQVAR